MSSFTSVIIAESHDTQAVMSLLVKTAEWLQSKGSSQWHGLLKREDSHNTPEAIKRGEVFLFKSEENLVGMFMLMRNPSLWDLELWGEQDHEHAVYLHRLAINRDYAGTGTGRRMMQWLNTGIPFPGKNTIRLDCNADNSILNSFYSGLGYEHKGTASNPNGHFCIYEKIIK
jgi:ribosomal protein S18 acetylase RimI-like enzyme